MEMVTMDTSLLLLMLMMKMKTGVQEGEFVSCSVEFLHVKERQKCTPGQACRGWTPLPLAS